MKTRSYSELVFYETLEERYDYLALQGEVGESTFGFDRWLNQGFYRSREWRNIRNVVIHRDSACDLGIQGFEIHDRLYVHHMIPITAEQIEYGDPAILDPEFLITVSHQTHNAIHYGDVRQLPRQYVPRAPGDTKLW